MESLDVTRDGAARPQNLRTTCLRAPVRVRALAVLLVGFGILLIWQGLRDAAPGGVLGGTVGFAILASVAYGLVRGRGEAWFGGYAIALVGLALTVLYAVVVVMFYDNPPPPIELGSVGFMALGSAYAIFALASTRTPGSAGTRTVA